MTKEPKLEGLTTMYFLNIKSTIVYSPPPFDSITNTGVLLPLFSEICKDGFSEGKNPTEIVNEFFKKYVDTNNVDEIISMLFRFIQYTRKTSCIV